MRFLKFRLAISALVPAALIVAIRVWTWEGWVWSAVLVAAAVIATVSLASFVRARGTTNPQPQNVVSVDDESDNAPALILTYLFPFLFLTVSDWRDAAAYVVFALVLLLLIVRTDIWKANPLLLIAGYRIYSVEFPSRELSLLFARNRPLPGSVIQVITLSAGVTKQVTPKEVS